jgi:hypothetical protein
LNFQEGGFSETESLGIEKCLKFLSVFGICFEVIKSFFYFTELKKVAISVRCLPILVSANY